MKEMCIGILSNHVTPLNFKLYIAVLCIILRQQSLVKETQERNIWGMNFWIIGINKWELVDA